MYQREVNMKKRTYTLKTLNLAILAVRDYLISEGRYDSLHVLYSFSGTSLKIYSPFSSNRIVHNTIKEILRIKGVTVSKAIPSDSEIKLNPLRINHCNN